MIPGITAGRLSAGDGSIPGDAFFSNVISLNHWDGTNGSTTYVDRRAAQGRTWANVVGAVALDTSEKKFGTASVKFPGTGNNQIVSDGGADWGFGSGDFTIEFWFRIASVAGNIMLWDQRTTLSQPRPCLFVQAGVMIYYVNATVQISAANLTAATWQHIALCRVGTTTRIFYDGVSQGTPWATDTTNYTVGRVSLGTAGDSPGFGTHAGAYDDLRVTKGIGRYSANFSPPIAAFPS